MGFSEVCFALPSQNTWEGLSSQIGKTFAPVAAAQWADGFANCVNLSPFSVFVLGWVTLIKDLGHSVFEHSVFELTLAQAMRSPPSDQ